MIFGDQRTHRCITLSRPLISTLTLLATLSITGCVDGGSSRQSVVVDKIGLSILRSNLRTLQERAALRGIDNLAPIAGIAYAEAGLAHCWVDATWTCRGPASSSCGGGPVIAGAGDGPCYYEQGGLGMFQLDGGTYNQTIARDGRGVLTLEGNIDAGIKFVVRMVRNAKSLSSDRSAIDWINGISVGGARYFDWIDIVVESYNGCIEGRCGVFLDRWYHYDGKTRAILDEVNRLPPVGGPIWIGSECTQNSDCLFSTDGGVARCLLGDTGGVCVTPCEGYCPDRSGFATTFCASGSQVGASAGGVCLSRAHPLNDQCADFDAQSVNRYVGRSGADERTEVVCVPSRTPITASDEVTSEPELDFEDETDETNEPAEGDDTTLGQDILDTSEDEPPANGICSDPYLPNAREACSSVDDERWRCACHEEYGVAVSQVCRGGTWINYRLEPSDCDQCVGDYSRACE